MKRKLVLLLVVFLFCISSTVLSYPVTDDYIASGITEYQGGTTWWFKGYGYLWGDDGYWYHLAIELWDESYSYILGQGDNTEYEDVIAITDKEYGYNPELIIAETPWVNLGQ